MPRLYCLPNLPYAYDALEPHIDAQTMEIHHTRHHQTYVNSLNDALAAALAAAPTGPDYSDQPVESLIAGLHHLPAPLQLAVRNHGGGHANHGLFWTVMAPAGRGGGGAPQGALAQAMAHDLGGQAGFEQAFTQAALSRFGSGWAWLVVQPNGHLAVESSANQDSPLMPGIGSGSIPILGLDVWEHAYYLHYLNRRPAYVAAFYQVIAWREVERRYAAALQESMSL